MNFSVNQKVICIDASFQVQNGLPPPLVLGQIYTVLGVNSCPQCHAGFVDVGLKGTGLGTLCGCGHRTQDGLWWVYSKRFAPIEEISETMFETLLETINKPEEVAQ